MKSSEANLRQIIREELLNELDTDSLDMYLDALNPFVSIKTAAEYYAGLAGEASVDPAAARRRFARDTADSGVQDVLGFLEYIPVIGAGAGVVNAGMYALQGNDQRALFSLAAGLMAGASGVGIAKALKTQGGQKFVANLDKKFEDAYRDAGVELVYMSEKDHAAWIEIAKKTSHKAFAEQVPGGAKLMEMALAVK